MFTVSSSGTWRWCCTVSTRSWSGARGATAGWPRGSEWSPNRRTCSRHQPCPSRNVTNLVTIAITTPRPGRHGSFFFILHFCVWNLLLLFFFKILTSLSKIDMSLNYTCWSLQKRVIKAYFILFIFYLKRWKYFVL